jgi:hypothetical protein
MASSIFQVDVISGSEDESEYNSEYNSEYSDSGNPEFFETPIIKPKSSFLPGYFKTATKVSTPFPTQKEAFKNADEQKHNFYYALDKQGRQGAKRYGSAPSHKSFLEYYNRLEKKAPKLCNFYELLRDSSPRCEYYDIDLKETENLHNKSPEVVFSEFNAIWDAFSLEICIPSNSSQYIKSKDFRVTDSSKQIDGVWKVSLHIVNRAVIWSSSNEAKFWYTMFEKFCKERYNKAVFDTAVSSGNRCMRIIGSSKFGQERPLLKAMWHEPSQSAKKEDFLIQNIDVEDSSLANSCLMFYVYTSSTEKAKATLKKQEEMTRVKKEKSVYLTVEESNIIEDAENLVCLISAYVSERKHSLCDKEITNKLEYSNMRNIAFAYFSTVIDHQIESDAKDFFKSDIFTMYRHADAYNASDMAISMWNSSFDRASIQTGKFTIKSLHLWAKENPEYNGQFGNKLESKNCITDCFEINHQSVSDIFYRKTGDEFVFTNEMGWLRQNQNGLYISVDCGQGGVTGLYSYIASIINSEFQEKLESVKDKLDEDDCQKIKKQMGQLKNTTFMRGVISWLQQNHLKKSIDFDPSKPYGINDGQNGKTLNIFEGFYAATLKGYNYNEDLVKPCINHIVSLCNNERDGSFLLDWIAQLIQFPSKKIGVCPIITSSCQGIGKDTIYQIIQAIIGSQYCLETADLASIVASKTGFNSILYKKFLVNFSEMENCDVKTVIEKFKAYVTRSEDEIMFKGKEKFTVPSITRYFGTSNRADVLMGNLSETNRRFWIVRSEFEKQSKEYFNALYKSLTDKNVIYSLFYYFSTRDISKQTFEIQQTDYMKDLQIASYPFHQTFLSSLENKDLENNYVSTNLMYEKYKFHVYSQVGDNAKCLTSVKFALFLKDDGKRFGISKIDKQVMFKGNRCMCFQIDVDCLIDKLSQMNLPYELKRESLLKKTIVDSEPLLRKTHPLML